MAIRELVSIAAALGIAGASSGCNLESTPKGGDNCTNAIPMARGSQNWEVKEFGSNQVFISHSDWKLAYPHNHFPQLANRHVSYEERCYLLVNFYSSVGPEYPSKGVILIRKPTLPYRSQP
jgi:hypothetical protein